MPALPNIRPLKPSDLKTVQYQIGSDVMAPLAVANNRAYFHPLTLAVWVALSSALIQFLNWWPTTNGSLGLYGLLSPLPGFAAVAVPLMFFFDWMHRPIFEDTLQKTLTATDMHDPLTHYTRSPASGFYVLENNDEPIGLIALDALPEAPPPSPSGRRTSSSKPAKTAETAVIRHFFVEDRYRPSEVQIDLLNHAVSRAFRANASPRPRRVRVLCSDLDSYKVKALRAAKFHPVDNWDGDTPREWKAGVYAWRNRWVELTRDEWEAEKER